MGNALVKKSKRTPAACLKAFSLNNEEWYQLDKQFHKLGKFQARRLIDKNNPGSHTDDYDDIEQEMRQHVIIAAMYHKRQCFIEDCFKSLEKYIIYKKDIKDFEELFYIWKNKEDRDGNKKKFGRDQEIKLQKMIDELVPEQYRPRTTTPLKMTEKFITYCKQISWNRIRTLGKSISKNKSIRTGLVSVSSYGYLASNGEID